MFEALVNPPSPPSYQSVKLPAALVVAAKESAQTFRRSTSGQIEYWAMLGKSVEAQGLNTQQAQDHITAAEKQLYLDHLTAKFLKAADDGTIARGVREVVARNEAKARELQAAKLAANLVPNPS